VLLLNQDPRTYNMTAIDAVVATGSAPHKSDAILPASDQKNIKNAGKPPVGGLAVTSFFFSALSFVGWAVLQMPMPALAAVGVVVGLITVMAFRRRPERSRDNRVAWSGIGIGLVNIIVFFALLLLSPPSQQGQFTPV